MSSSRARRIAKEIADIHTDSLSNISASPLGNGEDLTHLKGSFKGPPGTPYEGGTYTIDVRIPGEYPFRPPIMKFDTKVWHPNVSSQTVSAIIQGLCLRRRLTVVIHRVLSALTLFLPLGLLFSPSNQHFCLSSLCLVHRNQRTRKTPRLLEC